MQALTFIFAFVAVLALIGVAAWLVRQFASNRLGANTQRGRMPRLAVIDAAAVDGRRRLVLVRRDNVEHLLMIGGPTDIVVEPNIVRATPSRDALPQRPAGADGPPRIAPLPDANWTDGDDAFPHPEPQMPEPPPRPARPAFAEEVRRAAPPPMPVPERRAEPMGFPPEPMGRPEPRLEPRAEREPRVDPRNEPMPRGEPMPRNEQMPPRMPRGEPMMPRPTRRSAEGTADARACSRAGHRGTTAAAPASAARTSRQRGPESRRDGAASRSCPSPSGRARDRRAAGRARAAAGPRRAHGGSAPCSRGPEEQFRES